MNTLLLLLATSFALCLVFTPFLRQIALRCGLVDHPDGRRKIHSRPIPVVGGVAIFFATIFTAFWLLGAINSLNLIDGMDGLLGSVGAIITLSMALMAFLIGPGGWLAACVAAALAGALLGFLCFNFPPAAIFMGDCGSM